MNSSELKRKCFLIALLVAMFSAGVGVSDMFWPAIGAEGNYEKLKIFADVLSIIQSHYVEEVDTDEVLYGAIDGMLEILDPHSSFLPPEIYHELQVETKGSFGGLGIEITIKDGLLTVVSPIEDTPAYRVGIHAGDKIIGIEGESTEGINLIQAVKKLRGPKGTQVTITIMREEFEDPADFTIIRDIIEIQSIKSRLEEGRFGYVRIVQFQANTTEKLQDHIQILKEESGPLSGLVLDLRNNPGGLLDQAVKVVDCLLHTGLIVYTEGRVENQMQEFSAGKIDVIFDGPIVVLVNGGSASGSEIVAGALQDHGRAVILGTQTFGKGSVQTIIPLDDGSGLRLTTAKYFTPNGVNIQATGITPDIIVEIEGTESSRAGARKEKEEAAEDLEGHVTDKGTGGEKGTEESHFRDIQFERALEYLKTWEVFGKTALHRQSDEIPDPLAQ